MATEKTQPAHAVRPAAPARLARKGKKATGPGKSAKKTTPKKAKQEALPEKMDLSTFLVFQAVLHRLPKIRKQAKDSDAFEATLSEAPIVLTEDLRTFFRERILGSLDRQSFDAVFAPPPDESPVPADRSSVPDQVVVYFAADCKNLVDVSGEIARELFRRQHGGISGGLLAVIQATVGSGDTSMRVLVLLKMEDDKALLVEPSTDEDGKRTYAAEVRAVTLPEEAKVFKVAVFPPTSDLASLRARVSDNQRDANVYGKEVSAFFLSFLGCKLRESADRVTLNWADKAIAWANELGDDEKTTKYVGVVLAELDSASEVIRPSEIAQKLEEDDRDAFLDVFKAEDGSVSEITKDLTLFGERSKRMVYEYAGGLKLMGPREAMLEHVRQDEEGNWVIDVGLKRTAGTGQR